MGFPAYGITIWDKIQNYPFLFHQGLRLSRSGRLFWRDIFFFGGYMMFSEAELWLYREIVSYLGRMQGFSGRVDCSILPRLIVSGDLSNLGPGPAELCVFHTATYNMLSKTIGKPIGKPIGKWWFHGDLMGFSWIYPPGRRLHHHGNLSCSLEMLFPWPFSMANC